MNNKGYVYVKDLFQKKFPEYYLIFNNIVMLHIEKSYISTIREKIFNQYTSSDILDGIRDDEITVVLDGFLNEYFSPKQRNEFVTLYNYVNDYLKSKNIDERFSSDLFAHITGLIFSKVYSQYDLRMLGTNDMNNTILKEYDDICNQMRKKLNDDIDTILNNDFDFNFVRINKVEIDVNDLKRWAFNTLIKGKQHSFFVKSGYVYVNDSEKLTHYGNEIKRYIDYYISKKEKEQKKHENDSVNVVQNIVTPNVNVNVNNMINNSVQNDRTPKKMKSSSKKVKMNRSVSMLLVTASLVSVLGLSGYGINTAIQYKSDRDALNRYDSLNYFNYSQKYLRDDSYYNDMAINIIDFYFKLGQLDSELYKTLGFYDAYCGYVELYGKEPPVTFMDDLFQKVKHELRNYRDTTLSRTINNGDIGNKEYCFVDFVYDRLYELGHKEVHDDEHQYALLRYKYANYGNSYGVIGVTLSKGEEKIINDALKLYYDYCEKAKLEVGYIVVDGEHSFFDVDGTLKGVKR